MAGYDEDSLMMAVEAAIDCLRDIDSHTVDGIFFATTTSPYKEKQCSALMALPLDRLSAIWRERRVLLGLWGVKCKRCGTPQYDNGAMGTSPIRVCAECQAQDDFEDYNFAGRKARVFSFTHDRLAPVIDPPASVVLIEFEGGGRAFFDLTDRDPDKIEVGTEVEMTFRKMQFDRGITNYFWKARPIRC